MTRASYLIHSMPAETLYESSSYDRPPPPDMDDTMLLSNGCALNTGLLCCSNTVGQPPHKTKDKRLSLDSRLSSEFHPQTDYGLLITLTTFDDGTSRCECTFTPDARYPDIHPNAYAPANLKQMHKLGGGGSGVAVFEGSHPTLGDVVMKHGGDKDLKELFALATIAEELKERGRNHPEAAKELQQKIPEYRFVYISPHHLGEKRRELWYRLSHMYKYSSRNLLVLPEQEEAAMDELHMPGLQEEGYEEPEKATPLQNRRRQRHGMPHVPSRNGLTMSQSGTVTGHRDISIYGNSPNTCHCGVELLGDSLTVSIPPCPEPVGDGLRESIVIPGDGYAALKDICADLNRLMKHHKWKFTLGQKRIGGANPQTGNQWLYAGKLEGKLLDNLIAQNIRLVRDLATLTTEEEQSPHYLRAVQEESARFEEEANITPGDITTLSDSFVGNAIKKNFQEGSGRLPVLIQLGKQFRVFSQQHPFFRRIDSETSFHSYSSGSTAAAVAAEEDPLVLTAEEEYPAYHLGCLTRSGALMGDTFDKVPLEPTVLEMTHFYWRTVLRAAIHPHLNSNSMAVTRLWTCGLTDAGVHNLFLSEDSMWLFDLGQPQLYSAPGFLTKFLFSFFHTLGMEETSDGDSWVRRFEHNPVTNKLCTTPQTEKLLAKAYDAFEITLDRMIKELFDGEDSLRWLLIQYVTLQLISDASFCLQRWTIKGGGRPRDANHQEGLEKWLWRAIWDMYVAFDINTNESWTRLYVEHPSDRDSKFYYSMRELIEEADKKAKVQKMDDRAEEKEDEGCCAS